MKNKKYRIKVNKADSKSFDKNKYDFVFDPDGCDSDFSSVLEICTEEFSSNNKTMTAIIDDFYSENENRVILENNDLVILLSWSIIRLSLTENKIIRHCKLDIAAGAWNIYKVGNEYVVQCELDVIMLNQDLSVKWSVPLPDVSTTPNSKGDDFKIEENSVTVKCFDEKIISISFDGKATELL